MIPRYPIALLAASLTLAATAQGQVACPPPALPQPCGALVAGTPLPYDNSAAPAWLELPGSPTVEVRILGHSESRGYHVFLQPMLDANPPLPGVRFVVTNHFIGGHEAWRWRTPGQRGFARIGAILREQQHPMIVLGLFSNNESFPIETPVRTDPNYVKFVDDLEAIADRLHDSGNGAAMVYFSAHRYKQRNFLPSYYESCAVGELMQVAGAAGKGYMNPGPEQHDLHWCCFPACYAPDMSHPNVEGDRLMARAWYHLLVRELTGCASVPYGNGTAGAGPIPFLDPAGGVPMLGNQQFRLDSNDLPASTQSAYLLGTVALAGPVLVQPAIVLGATATPAGTHSLPLPLPAAPALHGAVLRAQVLGLDPTAPLGVATSQGLELHLCR